MELPGHEKDNLNQWILDGECQSGGSNYALCDVWYRCWGGVCVSCCPIIPLLPVSAILAVGAVPTGNCFAVSSGSDCD